MNQPNDLFNAWLESRSIDINSMAPELRAALVAQWTNEQRPADPPSSRVIIADDECWPHAERVPSF